MDRSQIALLLVLIPLSAPQPSLAQKSNDTISSYHSKTGSGFTSAAVVVLIILLAAFVLLTLLFLCIHRYTRAHRPPRSTAPVDGATPSSDHRRTRGLDRDIVEAFPTAVYGDLKARMAIGTKSGPLECAVCLAEFADAHELRVLPACCHVFHPGCIDTWLASAVTCPLCRTDLTKPARAAAESADLALKEVAVQELQEECSAVSFTAVPVSHNYYRRTQSALDAPDQHTLRLPDHVMKELTAVGRHRRAASLTADAEYPADIVDQRTPGWMKSFLRSMSWQRQRQTAESDAGEEHGGGGSKLVYPVAGAPSGSGSGADEKEEGSDVDALNWV